MTGVSPLRGVLVVLAGYIASAAWYASNAALPPSDADAQLHGAGLIAFVLPTTAAVLLWLFHVVEARRPVCVREPDDCAATERILFRILVFIASLHGLVLLLLAEVPWVRTWGVQLTFVLVGTLLVSVGNLLPTTRPNVLVGIRTRRSLRSRQFWMEINRVGGYVAVALGVVVIVAALGLGAPLVGQVILAAILAAIAVVVGRYVSLARGSERARAAASHVCTEAGTSPNP